MELDDLCPDDLDNDELIDVVLAALPRSEHGLKQLCSFLSDFSLDEGWILLFDEFSEIMDRALRQRMYDMLKKEKTRFELRNRFYRIIPEIEEEDIELVSKFPVTEEGFDQLFTFLKEESNCLVGWERLFSALFEKYMTDEKYAVILQVVLNSGDYEIIAAALGTEDAAKICGLDLEECWDYAEFEGSDYEDPV